MLRNLKNVEALPEADARLVLGGRELDDAAESSVSASPDEREDPGSG